MATKSVRVMVRLTEKLNYELEKLAIKLDLNKSDVVRAAIANEIARQKRKSL